MGISIMIGNRIATGKKSGAGYSGPAPLIHYDFSRYSNEDFLNNPDLLVKDLTGNGHDLKLYNFAFAGMSGFGGYSENYNEYYNFGTSYVTVTPTSFEVVGAYMGIHYLVALQQPREISSYKIKVSGVTKGHPLLYRYYTTDGTPTILELYNGIHVLPKSYINETDTQKVGFMGEGGFQIGVKVEQLPIYPGGLVSDGVDDYGRCVKEFSLPDDFTVVAIRRIISGNSASLVNKGQASGAFMLEGLASDENISNYSYGQITYSRTLPALFSYLTKTSYNGEKVTAGTAVDDDAKLLVLFTSSNKYQNAVLYDLRIYDHSLTDEELQLVKDDMMRNYEKYAKPLDGINYVCDFDAKGRSNDEDADVRNKWIDKATGKVIDLNNYAFAGMSGWGGYNYDFAEFIITVGDASNYIQGNIIHIGAHNNTANVGYPVSPNQTVKIKVKVEGVSACVANGDIDYLNFYMNSGDSETINKDGSYDINVTASNTGTRFYIYAQKRGVGSEWTPLSTPITIEQLPLYPGALVSDGVDDNGVTQDAISEDVGTALIHCKLLTIPTKWGYYIDGVVTPTRIYMAYTPDKNIISNLAAKYKDDNILYIGTVQGGSPLQGNDNLYVASNTSPSENGQVALYRLILIREQLDDAQVEFLKWKVEKEYREWCKKNGYNYALNQLTE